MYLVVAALIFWGVLMTGSRTGTLAMGVVLLALAWSGPRRARLRILGVFAVGLVAALSVWVYQPVGVASRSFESATSSSGRLEIWSVGLAACPDACWYGAGWGTFSTVYAETQASVPSARVLAGTSGAYQAHNVWLLALVELGIPGLVLLAWAVVRGVTESWRLPRAVRGPPWSALIGLVFAVFFLSSLEFKCFWMTFILITLNRNRVLCESQG
jgi:O-antigen ligase